MIFAMCITCWLDMARFVRNLIVIIRDREYNLASRCLGTPTRRIITKNLLPYLVSVIMLRMALAIPAAIGYEVFLNLYRTRFPVSIPSLGNLINEGRRLMMSSNFTLSIDISSHRTIHNNYILLCYRECICRCCRSKKSCLGGGLDGKLKCDIIGKGFSCKV